MAEPKKPAIPVVTTGDRAVVNALTAVRENIELLTGMRPGIDQISQLASTASTADMITKINQIIARLNYQGK
jgi:hypothetical protein